MSAGPSSPSERSQNAQGAKPSSQKFRIGEVGDPPAALPGARGAECEPPTFANSEPWREQFGPLG
eukprot:11742846-Alexandrium_andersonii.AAC.1